MTVPNATSFRKKIYEFMTACPIDPTESINAGDMAYFDSGTTTYKVCDDDTKAANFAGVFNDTNPIPSLKETISEVRIDRHGVFEFFGTVGETYVTGDAAYVGADAQTITTTAGMMVNYIGRIAISNGTGTMATVAAGAKIPVAIGPRHLPLV